MFHSVSVFGGRPSEKMASGRQEGRQEDRQEDGLNDVVCFNIRYQESNQICSAAGYKLYHALSLKYVRISPAKLMLIYDVDNVYTSNILPEH